MTESPSESPSASYDVAIIGGGIAGLWLLDRLRSSGYRVILLEAQALGAAQTLASQGMIHGGLKYTLSGRLSSASEAIADMPARWRACLDGTGDVDLRGLTPLAQQYFMFAAAGTLGRMTTFFASRNLAGRITRLTASEYPPPFDDPGFGGSLYALNDFVMHTPSLLQHLQERNAKNIYRHEVQASDVSLTENGITLQLSNKQSVHCQRLVLCAGAGNGELLSAAGFGNQRMQRRGLAQVIVRGPNLPAVYAHCLTRIRRAEPRLTITSHREQDGSWLWYLGGQIATDGINRTDAEQQEHARTELTKCLPWLNWTDIGIELLRIDRAEPEQAGAVRPDEAFVVANPRAILAWPTKLSLVPNLADQVCAQLDNPRALRIASNQTSLALPTAEVASEPWEH